MVTTAIGVTFGIRRPEPQRTASVLRNLAGADTERAEYVTWSVVGRLAGRGRETLPGQGEQLRGNGSNPFPRSI